MARGNGPPLSALISSQPEAAAVCCCHQPEVLFATYRSTEMKAYYVSSLLFSVAPWAIRRVDRSVQLNPPPTEILQAGDVVIVLGHQDDLPEIARRFVRKRQKMTYRGITVEN